METKRFPNHLPNGQRAAQSGDPIAPENLVTLAAAGGVAPTLYTIIKPSLSGVQYVALPFSFARFIHFCRRRLSSGAQEAPATCGAYGRSAQDSSRSDRNRWA